MSEFCKACNVFCYPAADQAIVAAVYNHGGLYAEIPNGAAKVAFADGHMLDRAIDEALERCRFRLDFDYSRAKRADWPAYLASGCKTIKRFEADFIRLFICGVNERNFFYEVSSPGLGEFNLTLKATVPARAEQYGQVVQYVVSSFLTCQIAMQV